MKTQVAVYVGNVKVIQMSPQHSVLGSVCESVCVVCVCVCV